MYQKTGMRMKQAATGAAAMAQPPAKHEAGGPIRVIGQSLVFHHFEFACVVLIELPRRSILEHNPDVSGRQVEAKACQDMHIVAKP